MGRPVTESLAHHSLPMRLIRYRARSASGFMPLLAVPTSKGDGKRIPAFPKPRWGVAAARPIDPHTYAKLRRSSSAASRYKSFSLLTPFAVVLDLEALAAVSSMGAESRLFASTRLTSTSQAVARSSVRVDLSDSGPVALGTLRHPLPHHGWLLASMEHHPAPGAPNLFMPFAQLEGPLKAGLL